MSKTPAEIAAINATRTKEAKTALQGLKKEENKNASTAESAIDRAKKIQEYEQKSREAFDKVRKESTQLIDAGMKGYDDWVSSMLDILVMCMSINSARGYEQAAKFKKYNIPTIEPSRVTGLLDCVGPILRAPITIPKAIYGALTKDKGSDDMPNITWNVGSKDGKVDFANSVPTIAGLSVADYFAKAGINDDKGNNNTKGEQLAEQFSQSFRAGFEDWLATKGYDVEVDRNVTPNSYKIVKADDPRKGSELTLDELTTLNNTPPTFEDFISERLEMKVNPENSTSPSI